MGGIKDMLFPPCQNMGGYITPIPPRIYALDVNSIAILDVTCDQVRNVISSLNNSSAGYDELPPFVAKSCVDGFIEPITYMVNESLTL